MRKLGWILLISGGTSALLALLQFPFSVGTWGATLARMQSNYQMLIEKGIAQKHIDAMPTLLTGIELIQFRQAMQWAACFLVFGLIQIGAAIAILRQSRNGSKLIQPTPQS
ncbi:MAG: hypothetical protein U0640_06085 [Phycisphaerales bacterium]